MGRIEPACSKSSYDCIASKYWWVGERKLHGRMLSCISQAHTAHERKNCLTGSDPVQHPLPNQVPLEISGVRQSVATFPILHSTSFCSYVLSMLPNSTLPCPSRTHSHLKSLVKPAIATVGVAATTMQHLCCKTACCTCIWHLQDRCIQADSEQTALDCAGRFPVQLVWRDLKNKVMSKVTVLL